jgi:hypothetical protein
VFDRGGGGGGGVLIINLASTFELPIAIIIFYPLTCTPNVLIKIIKSQVDVQVLENIEMLMRYQSHNISFA